MRGSTYRLLLLLAVTAAYFAAAELGLTQAFIHPSVSPIWPATGVAIAAILWGGYRLAPAIMLGAFLANITTGVSVWVAAGIAIGNTLEAASAGYLLEWLAGTRKPFSRAVDVLRFVIIAALVSPALSATIGNLSLCVGGEAQWNRFGALWLTWWLGDGVGALVTTPLLLVWLERPFPRWSLRSLIEPILMLALLLVASAIVFGGLLPVIANYALEYLTIPFLLWAAFRFKMRGVTVAAVVLSATSVWGARHALGPSLGIGINELLLLQRVFIAVGATTGLIVAAIVDERERAEKSSLFLASIVDSTDDAVIGKSLDGTILSWNSGAEQLYGYSSDEVVGKDVSILEPGKIDEFEDILERLKRGERIYRFETERKKKDGQTLFVSLTISPILDGAGKPAAASIIARDITDRKLVEQEREKLLLLEQEARSEAEAANRAKDQFIANVSHELRTPLNSILGWTHILRRSKFDPAMIVQAVDTIERSATSQRQLVADLLDASQIAAGRLELSPHQVDLSVLLDHVVHMVRPIAESKSISLKTDFHEPAGALLADPDRLKQIMWNLLTNAVKYTPQGGTVEIRVEACDQEVRVIVSDTGIGISPEVASRVFDRFYQAPGTDSKQGVGLGLSITRHLVELHGGAIRAESPGEGLGSTFTVELPRSHLSDV